MATTPLPITIIAGTLPSGAVYNPQTYFNAIVARMSASVAGGNILWGQIGGTQPNGQLPNNGLWFGDPEGGSGYWNDWNSVAQMYLPIPLVCGQYIGGQLLTSEFVCGALSADRTLTTPDESGTLALLSDIPQQLGTQTYSGMATISIDGTSRPPVYILMTGNVTVNIGSNFKDGMLLDFFLENATGANTFVIAMPGVNWSGYWNAAGTAWVPGSATAPPLSAGVSGKRVVDHIRVYHAGGLMFGTLLEPNYQLTGGHTTPVPTSATGQVTQINVAMSAVLAGGSLLASDFTVRVNGTADPIANALYSGQMVTVNVQNNIPQSATVTISYSGTDMKSLAGDTVATFTNFPVTMIGGSGIHNSPQVGPTGIPKSPP